ncbi:MAG TPA: O-antigen ligase domain-containing protein [Candidatus Hydrogenedentes bacterium]|nr:O-antigen ligase domain-containing protein [Candidatus Hydrogenedentota bacterium]HQH53393.1 O-antigen ligase domain-containing protein [Candidatus Hydrogenedentota bacterium]HQM47240.1 O-antigen ligase domain-containing protein [Candidatus Hydrogenedentota bacterium]
MQATHGGNALVGIALFGWIPLVLLLFALLPPRRAALLGFLGGWMFLPCGGYEIKFFPEYNKTSAVCIGIFLATLIFDTGRITRFRFHWLDLFPVMSCVVPFFSSLSNGLGAYDGFSSVASEMTIWMFPYLIGRLYFTDFRSMNELILAIFIAGMVYAPFCLFEIRFSPNLHYWVYGFQQSPFVTRFRLGGFRPTVFMRTGLMLSLFMGFTALSGFGLWISRAKEDFLGLPLWVSVAALAATTVLCKSTGALLLVFVGLISLLAVKYLRTSLPVIMLACATIMYIIIRGSGLWSGTELVDVASATVGQERADSLGLRIVNETALAERAREHLLLGWGGWGDSRIVDEEGRDTSITDGYWIIVFGTRGALGLTAFLGTVLGPALFLPYRISGKNWMFPAIAPAAIGALILCLWMLDCIPNAMFNPIYLVVAGGLAGFRRVGVPRAQEVRVPTRPLKYAARHPGGATNAEHT